MRNENKEDTVRGCKRRRGSGFPNGKTGELWDSYLSRLLFDGLLQSVTACGGLLQPAAVCCCLQRLGAASFYSQKGDENESKE